MDARGVGRTVLRGSIRDALIRELRRTGGNVLAAAELAGVSRMTVYRRAMVDPELALVIENSRRSVTPGRIKRRTVAQDDSQGGTDVWPS